MRELKWHVCEFPTHGPALDDTTDIIIAKSAELRFFHIYKFWRQWHMPHRAICEKAGLPPNHTSTVTRALGPIKLIMA